MVALKTDFLVFRGYGLENQNVHLSRLSCFPVILLHYRHVHIYMYIHT